MPQEITIQRVLNGFTVIAGCQTLAFNDTEMFISELASWIRDPERTEARYMKLMKTPLQPPPQPIETASLAGTQPVNAYQQAVDVAALQAIERAAGQVIDRVLRPTPTISGLNPVGAAVGGAPAPAERPF